MDLCIIIQDRQITITAPSDCKVQKQIIEASREYLEQLYELLSAPSDINVSMMFSIQPKTCCICMDGCSNPVEVDCVCREKYYHAKCLDKWFQRKKECPTCRKKITGRGYKPSKNVNPYRRKSKKARQKQTKTSNSPSGFIYECPGGTHPKKSSFKSLFSALKHAKEKHGVDIGFRTRRGQRRWFCRNGECTGSDYEFNDEDLLRHLQDVHHLSVVISK